VPEQIPYASVPVYNNPAFVMVGATTICIILLCLLLATDQFGAAEAHSFMLKPKGDFKSYNKAECRLGGPLHAPNDTCPGPCIDTSSWQYDKNATATTYKRGDFVTMVWARNNHKGGFVRFSLVPKNMRMSKQAHNRLTFRWACYNSDRHECHGSECGTDSEAYRTKVEIPSSFPDGEYILGWAWFGGTVQKKSKFGDYYSCSSVVIRGGPLKRSYMPKFIPGENLGGATNCSASTNRPGKCIREPCDGLVERGMVPYRFSDGRKPSPILSSWFRNSTNMFSSPSPRPPSPSPSPVYLEDKRGPVLVTGLVLINADTGADITSEVNKTIHLSNADKNITFVALTSGPVDVVRFYLNGGWIRREFVPPYSFWGDISGDYKRWPKPILNKWINIRVEAWDEQGSMHYKIFWMYLVRKIQS